MLRRLLYFLPFLIVLALPVGCASDNDLPDDHPSGKTTVSFSIRALPTNLATRADGTPQAPVNDQEKINDWWMVFVDKNGTVVKKIYRSGANQGNYSGFEAAEHSGTGAIEEETFSCDLPAGTYSVYAFANLNPSDLVKADNSVFDIEDNADWESALLKQGLKLNLWGKDKNVPMSGFLENITVSNRIEELFSIEVVRMVAKIEFQFINPTSTDITVESVSLDPITKTQVSLFPDYSVLATGAYTERIGADYEKIEYSFTESEKGVSANTSSPKSIYFYCNESLSKRANEGRFTVGLKTKRGGQEAYDQYNVTSDIKGYINRNDWIVIPITLSDYAVKVNALFYPPIGGYPAIQSKTDIDGAYYFTFGTQGEFSINPYVVDLSKGPNAYLPANRYTIEIGEIGYVEGSENMFTETPTLSTVTREIIGTLGEAEGTACIPLTIKVKDGGTSDKETVYSRVIYIIRKNGDTGTRN